MITDTIAAIATPPGEGGIGIVRISGSESFDILNKVFQPKNKKNWLQVKSQTMHLGKVIDSQGNTVDEVLVSVMRGPKTFTAEDVVEINCHGGLIPLKKTLEVVLETGARLAERGEFSKRAFLNGRIDLVQAESIIDVIRAKTDSGLKAAVGQLQGKLSEKIRKLRHEILGMLAVIEAGIDFPDEETGDISAAEIIQKAEKVLEEIQVLVMTADRGKIIREGISTVIAGRTNVGKSSLLNALLGEKRAIVTDVPGTTRDTIEEYINIGGFPLKIVDTAGIRDTEDLVEKIGVQKSRELLGEADLILIVLDVVSGILDEDIKLINSIRERNAIVLINKIDVADNKLDTAGFEKILGEIPHIYVSAKEETGIDQLEKLIEEMVVKKDIQVSDDFMVTNVRHKNCLLRAAGNLKEVKRGILSGMCLDIVSIDLKEAWEALGEITGDSVGENLLDRIFSDFCIGK